LAESSRSVFSGRLLIDQDAQKSDAGQLNQTMLLGDKAEIDTKPQLEVYADDVKAAHGASVGGLRDEELFYLQSRAINREQASAMLAEGFLSEVILQLDSKEMQRKASEIIRRALPEFLKGSLT
jgi:Fe-S cluster assembly protein SufD